MADHESLLGESLSACGPDIVETDHLEHARTRESGDDGGGDGGECERGKDKVCEDIEDTTVSARGDHAAAGQHSEHQREHDDEDHAQPE